MNLKSVQVLLITFEIISIAKSSKVVLIMDDIIESCVPKCQEAKVVDRSEIELVVVTDEDVYLNGTLKFLKKLSSPVPVHTWAEKFIGGKWELSTLNVHRADVCFCISNPLELTYAYTKHLKPCPRKIGVRVI